MRKIERQSTSLLAVDGHVDVVVAGGTNPALFGDRSGSIPRNIQIGPQRPQTSFEGMEMTQRGANEIATKNRNGWLVFVLAVLLAGQVDAMVVRSSTGLRATVYSAREIQDEWLAVENGRTYLRHPVVGNLELDLSQASDTLVPLDVVDVAAALETVQGITTDLEVHVFVLPAFPVEIESSFARRDAIFLAPAFGPMAAETTAYLVTHELGHVLCWAAVDPFPERWDEYRAYRGFEIQSDPASVPHAQRHREIIAEDFRYLFGGSLATVSGTIENAGITLPDDVRGLRELLAGYVLDADWSVPQKRPSQVFPNPCRESVRVELSLGDRASKSVAGVPVLEVFDVRGRLVHRLHSGLVTNGRAVAMWDGVGRDGHRVAAGIYLYRISVGSQVGSGRILLLDH